MRLIDLLIDRFLDRYFSRLDEREKLLSESCRLASAEMPLMADSRSLQTRHTHGRIDRNKQC